ncbi:MAG TPA: 5-oxoprolinase subunit PxpA [Gemmatimonadaceae bacterium]|nr:5-oxoprolinase subunit PxpA [Gemmatimonadaceae bacterium]
MPLIVDLNADLGEAFGSSRIFEDVALLELVSSANIACGFHAGDATTMRDTVNAAKVRGVTIGAHPSYPDIPGFGRRELGLPPKQILFHVATQLRALRDICGAEGARLAYVKPHGALYNRAARDRDAANAIVMAIREVGLSLTLLGLAGSEMAHAAARAGIAFASEAFVDRAYKADGTLVPRDQPGAVINDVKRAVQRAVMLVKGKTITADDGTELRLSARSLCVHGDNPDAAPMLRTLRKRLEESGVTIAPFAA